MIGRAIREQVMVQTQASASLTSHLCLKLPVNKRASIFRCPSLNQRDS